MANSKIYYINGDVDELNEQQARQIEDQIKDGNKFLVIENENKYGKNYQYINAESIKKILKYK